MIEIKIHEKKVDDRLKTWYFQVERIEDPKLCVYFKGEIKKCSLLDFERAWEHFDEFTNDPDFLKQANALIKKIEPVCSQSEAREIAKIIEKSIWDWDEMNDLCAFKIELEKYADFNFEEN